MIWWKKAVLSHPCRAFVSYWGLPPSWCHCRDQQDRLCLAQGMVVLGSGCRFLQGNMSHGQASCTSTMGLPWHLGVSITLRNSLHTTITPVLGRVALPPCCCLYPSVHAPAPPVCPGAVLWVPRALFLFYYDFFFSSGNALTTHRKKSRSFLRKSQQLQLFIQQQDMDFKPAIYIYIVVT